MLITDGRRLTGNQYDRVIVGSGPAGLTVALNLAAANRRVLVLETNDGGDDHAPSLACGLSSNEEHADMRVCFEARTGAAQYAYRVNLRTEMRPAADNRVVLTAERDRTGLHRPAAHCLLDAEDFRNAVLTLRELGRTLVGENRGRLHIENDLIYQSDQGGGHIIGTTRMGTAPSNSVVDRNCRVHGNRNFFLAGSSVFPNGGYANPTFTIVALASRLAREIRGA